MKLLTNDKLAAMSTKAADSSNFQLVRLIDTALTYRVSTIETVGEKLYVVSNEAAETIVRAIWHAGKRANVSALIVKHGKFWANTQGSAI